MDKFAQLRQLVRELENHGRPEIMDTMGEILEELSDVTLSNDTPQRRCFLTAFERFIQLKWQRNKFKFIADPFIGQFYKLLISKAKEIQFSKDKFWFGGVSHIFTSNLVCCSSSQTSNAGTEPESYSQQQRLNAIPYFSIGLTLLGLLGNDKSTNEELVAFFRGIETCFSECASHFVDALLENDERCLRTLIVLLRVSHPFLFN